MSFYKIENLRDHVKAMRSMALMMSEYSYPQTQTDEDDIACLKQREIIVDGWHCVVYYGKADYNKFWLDILSVTNKYGVFLPFPVVVKVANAFLGTKELAFCDHIKSGKKVYTWMQFTDKNDAPIPCSMLYNGKPVKYRGLDFSIVDPDNLQGTKPPPQESIE